MKPAILLSTAFLWVAAATPSASAQTEPETQPSTAPAVPEPVLFSADRLGSLAAALGWGDAALADHVDSESGVLLLHYVEAIPGDDGMEPERISAQRLCGSAVTSETGYALRRLGAAFDDYEPVCRDNRCFGPGEEWVPDVRIYFTGTPATGPRVEALMLLSKAAIDDEAWFDAMAGYVADELAAHRGGSCSSEDAR